MAAVAAVGVVVALAGCGAGGERHVQAAPPKPELFGNGPRFMPKPGAHRAPGMRCRRGDARDLAHLEIFVGGRVVLIPRGIGRRRGCDYPIRTTEPTGLVEVERGPRRTLGDLFAIWGEPLGLDRVLSFRGRVRAYVGDRQTEGDPRAIELGDHAVVTLEIGRYVRPHTSYVFPP